MSLVRKFVVIVLIVLVVEVFATYAAWYWPGGSSGSKPTEIHSP